MSKLRWRVGVFFCLLSGFLWAQTVDGGEVVPAASISTEQPLLDLNPYWETVPALTPPFSLYRTGKLKAAKAGFEAFVQNHPESRALPMVKLLLSHIATKRKKNQEAHALLEEVALYPPLASLAMLRLGNLLQAGEDLSGSVDAYGAVHPDSPLFSRARLSRAQVLRRLKRHEEARADAMDVWKRGLFDKEGSEAKLLLADLALDENDSASARSYLETMWWNREVGAEKAEARLRSLGESPNRVDRLLRDVDRLSRYNVRERKKELRKRIKAFRGARFAPLRKLTEASIRMNIRRERESAPAMMEAALNALSQDDPYRPWYRLGSALALRRNNRDLESAQAYAHLVENHPNHLLMARALLGAGTLYVANGLPLEGSRHLRRLAEDFPGALEHEQALWELGWLAYLAGEYQQAISFWDRLGRKDVARKERSRATWKEKVLYWRARAELRRGRHKEASVAFREVIHRHPLSYHALLATGWLKEIDPTWEGNHPSVASELIPAPPARLAELKLAADSSLETVAELIRGGLHQDARRELRGRLASGDLTAEGLTLLVALYQVDGNASQARWFLRRHTGSAAYPRGALLGIWYQTFSIEYRELVERFAKESGVSAALILAIIRHESHFNPKTVSFANAVGLMQILPSVAGTVATELLDEKAPRKRDLKKPEINIRIGSRLLAELLSMYRDNPVLAIAGYNAGAFAVKRWLARYGHLATDELLEMVPFKGTSSYAKRVLASTLVYHALYGDRQGGAWVDVPLDLPVDLGPYMEKPQAPSNQNKNPSEPTEG